MDSLSCLQQTLSYCAIKMKLDFSSPKVLSRGTPKSTICQDTHVSVGPEGTGR